MLMKISNDTIGNRTREFSVCSAVPLPTPLHRVQPVLQYSSFIHDVSIAQLTQRRPTDRPATLSPCLTKHQFVKTLQQVKMELKCFDQGIR
jgi:hypothetical protein